MQELEEVWNEKNRILKELTGLRDATRKLEEDTKGLDRDSEFLRKSSKFVEKEVTKNLLDKTEF